MPTPTPTWNGFTAGSRIPLQAMSFLNMFAGACAERGLAVGPVAAGDNLQIWNLLAGWQIVIPGSGLAFVDKFHENDLAGTFAGVPTMYTLGSIYTEAAGAYTLGNPRVIDRDIYKYSDTVDIQGNAAVAGQIARPQLPIPGPPIGPGALLSWQKYDGTHWNRISVAEPDTLQSYAAAPNAMALQADHRPGAIDPNSGINEPGDRQGAWSFACLRDLLNLMVWTWSGYVGASLPLVYKTCTGTGSTWAAAQADATARWNAGIIDPLRGPLGTWSSGSFDGTTYTAILNRVGIQMNYTVPGTLNANLDWWYCASSAISDVPGAVFDANGESVAVGWNKVTTTVGATGATVGPLIANPTGAMPNWCAAPTGTGFFNSTWRGWSEGVTAPADVVYGLVIVKFDVIGGYQYTELSP